ncbi:MAG: FGGY family carbohydrate kinase, partial [Acutalibacteraceae bacterium]
ETGIKSASGFGLTTHFYNVINGEVPKDAVRLTTIHDYLVSVLTGRDVVTHSSDGASLGFYDLVKNEFSREALRKAGIAFDMLPRVLKTTSVAGTTNCDFLPEGIPVSVAIGDNQASFLGSVAERESILVNVGTGSQVSFITKNVKTVSCGEIRPLTDDDYIFVGSSLCGGRAYAILKNFFTLCADFLGGNSDDLYNRMNELSVDVFDLKDPLNVNCEFCGTRENPNKRGFIENISEDNFTPTHLICGFLKGVSKELKDMYDSARILLDFEPKELVCSGNGLRKSGVWRKIFENDFSLKSTLPKHSEEAAVGACIFSSVASGIYNNIEDAQNALLR